MTHDTGSVGPRDQLRGKPAWDSAWDQSLEAARQPTRETDSVFLTESLYHFSSSGAYSHCVSYEDPAPASPFPLSPAVHLPWAWLCPAANWRGQTSTKLTSHSGEVSLHPSLPTYSLWLTLDRFLSPPQPQVQLQLKGCGTGGHTQWIWTPVLHLISCRTSENLYKLLKPWVSHL